jgi:hypothetical protein
MSARAEKPGRPGEAQVTASTWTADELEAGMRAALRAHDVEAVYGLLLLLALKDPYRADELRRTFKAALAIAKSCGEVPT